MCTHVSSVWRLTYKAISHGILKTNEEYNTVITLSCIYLSNIQVNMKSLTIPKGSSEAVNQWIGSAMAKIKRANNDLQNTTQKTKD